MNPKITLLLCFIVQTHCSIEKSSNHVNNTESEPIVRLENFPKITQETNYYSGPAVVEAMLRYFQMKNSTFDLSSIYQNDPSLQRALGRRLYTTYARTKRRGTDIWRIALEIKDQINRLNSDASQNYEVTAILQPTLPNAHFHEFHSLVMKSLDYSMPVIVAYNRTNKQFNGSIGATFEDQHFIVITGVEMNDIKNVLGRSSHSPFRLHDVIYDIMDPAIDYNNLAAADRTQMNAENLFCLFTNPLRNGPRILSYQPPNRWDKYRYNLQTNEDLFNDEMCTQL